MCYRPMATPELLTFFSEIHDGGRRQLDFSGYVNLAIRVDSVVLVLCNIFGYNTCTCH